MGNRMKKTCERCAALIVDDKVGGICTLGYLQTNYRPQEECPKPLTQQKLTECISKDFHKKP